MDYNDLQKLINIEKERKNRYWKISITIISITNLIISSAVLGNIIYGYTYIEEQDYGEVIKNVTKFINKACKQFNC